MSAPVNADLFSVAGRVACVTGASSGIGRALATALAKAGARVVGLARRADALEAWQHSFRSKQPTRYHTEQGVLHFTLESTGQRKMKALVYTGPEALDLRDAPDPARHAGDALINVAHVGICGSDMHAWAGHDERRPAPLILGHEAAGMVIDGRENLCSRRQIISMPPREGAFAQQLAIPPGNLVPIPDDIPTGKAVLAEPIACGWHAVRLARGGTCSRACRDQPNSVCHGR